MRQTPTARWTATRSACGAFVLAMVGAAAPVRAAVAQGPIPILQGMSASASSFRDSLVALARSQLGRRYRIGGSSPERGFDCSGLVQYVLARLELVLPRTARQQATTGVAIPRDTSQLRPGDLVTFAWNERSRVSHIGIYVGDGRFVHASSVAGRVIESALDRAPAPRIKVWRGVRRLPWFVEESTTAANATAAPER